MQSPENVIYSLSGCLSITLRLQQYFIFYYKNNNRKKLGFKHLLNFFLCAEYVLWIKMVKMCKIYKADCNLKILERILYEYLSILSLFLIHHWTNNNCTYSYDGLQFPINNFRAQYLINIWPQCCETHQLRNTDPRLILHTHVYC